MVMQNFLEEEKCIMDNVEVGNAHFILLIVVDQYYLPFANHCRFLPCTCAIANKEDLSVSFYNSNYKNVLTTV